MARRARIAVFDDRVSSDEWKPRSDPKGHRRRGRAHAAEGGDCVDERCQRRARRRRGRHYAREVSPSSRGASVRRAHAKTTNGTTTQGAFASANLKYVAMKLVVLTLGNPEKISER